MVHRITQFTRLERLRSLSWLSLCSILRSPRCLTAQLALSNACSITSQQSLTQCDYVVLLANLWNHDYLGAEPKTSRSLNLVLFFPPVPIAMFIACQKCPPAINLSIKFIIFLFFFFLIEELGGELYIQKVTTATSFCIAVWGSKPFLYPIFFIYIFY